MSERFTIYNVCKANRDKEDQPSYHWTSKSCRTNVLPEILP